MDGAKVYLEFTNIDSDIEVYLRASSDYMNTTSVAISDLSGEVPEVGVKYEIDQGASFIITAVPKEGRTNTMIEFKYSTDGKAYERVMKYYHEYFKKNEQGETFFYIFIGCVGLIVLIILCCICCCIKACCCKKKNQIVQD